MLPPIDWFYEFHAPEITQEVLDKGLVIAFFTYDGYVRSMPIVNYLGFNINIKLYAIAESKAADFYV